MRSLQVEIARFPNGNRARVLRVSRYTPIGEVVEALQIPSPRAVLVCNGGTGAMEPGLEAQLARILQDGAARLAVEEQLTVITGGTDAGIFHLLGQGFARWGSPAVCIGVAVDALVTWPDRPGDGEPLEPHHSHFCLVEGQEWGNETEMMYTLAARLAADCPSLALYANAGEIGLSEMQSNVAQGREMILLAGSGRYTDTVLHVREGQQTDDDRILQIARSGKISSYDIGDSPSGLAKLIAERLQLGREARRGDGDC